jgi:DNA-binding MarR family transcriptional regulator
VSAEVYPLWTLIQAANVVSRGFTAVFAEFGLTPTQFGVLAYLAEGDGLTQAELARRVLVRPQSLGELVAPLLERGLVHRDGPGGRGRRSGLTLTGDGAALLQRALPRVQEFHAPASSGLDAPDLVRLEELLQRVLAARST